MYSLAKHGGAGFIGTREGDSRLDIQAEARRVVAGVEEDKTVRWLVGGNARARLPG